MSITITIPHPSRLLEDPAKLLFAAGEPCLVLLAGALGLGPIGQTLLACGFRGTKHLVSQANIG